MLYILYMYIYIYKYIYIYTYIYIHMYIQYILYRTFVFSTSLVGKKWRAEAPRPLSGSVLDAYVTCLYDCYVLFIVAIRNLVFAYL